jgi:hypothetical protein
VAELLENGKDQTFDISAHTDVIAILKDGNF